MPSAVIIKQVSPEGYDPEKVDAWDTSRFFRDWAGAWFLTEYAPDQKHGPAFYGGDREQGFIILEDMGEHTSLVEPLLEGDAAGASAALIAFAKRLGAMHASAFGKEEAFRAIQHEISPAWAALSVQAAEQAQQERAKRIAEFAEIFTGLDMAIGKAEMEEFEAALMRLEAQGPFRTFLHSDPCPDNVFYHAPELRLIDFEFSTFGHALQDGLYGRLPFPTCWCANTVPAEVVRQMEESYRAELAVACSEARDDTRFYQEAAAVAANAVFHSLRWHLKGALEQDGDWGIAGTRARILSRILMFLDTAAMADQMPALRTLYGQALTELQSRWPDAAPLPLYPAFRNSSRAELPKP